MSGRPVGLCPSPCGRRMVALVSGLVLFGISLALLVEADLGLDPWDVFHQGIARTTDTRLGVVVIAVSVAVLTLWVPLRQRVGLGTVLNAVLVGVVFEAAISVVPTLHGAGRAAALIVGVVVNGFATALYIGAGLGPGPRDGLMTGLAERGPPIRTVRTGIEITVLAAGWLMGGTVGIGTVVYAVSIGPVIELFLSGVSIPPPTPAAPPTTTARKHSPCP